MCPRLCLFLCCLSAMMTQAIAHAEKPFLPDVRRIVFLGDSNMYAGGVVQYVEAYLFTQFPARTFEVINLGLPSEGVTGLSEPEHPFPRPNLHERLDRALIKTKPDLVIACYGMNDGIYYPFSEERFAAYKQGIQKLIDRVKQSGAPLILLTPPPFDADAVKNVALPDHAPKYSWMQPFAGYDGVLERYSRWLTTLKGKNLRVIDVHKAVGQHIANRRKENPGYHLAGDGVHFGEDGANAVAQTLLRALSAPHISAFAADTSEKHRDLLKLVQQRERLLTPAWVTEVGHQRPGTERGLPLAEAVEKAKPLEAQIRDLTKR